MLEDKGIAGTMYNLEAPTVLLENFEGPIDLLLYLTQKSEIDIYDIPITEITHQYLLKLKELVPAGIDIGAEFLAATSSLMLLKSRSLLPRTPNVGEGTEEEDPNPRYELLQQLIEYCQFKELAKKLSEREESQLGYYPRGIPPTPPLSLKGPQVLEQLTLLDLAEYLQESLEKTQRNRGEIQEDEWRVGDKIEWIRHLMSLEDNISLNTLFPENASKIALIVTFLALLELLKQGFLQIYIENSNAMTLKRC